MRYHQVIRVKNKTNILGKEIDINNVYKSSYINDYYEFESRKLTLTIEHKDIIMLDGNIYFVRKYIVIEIPPNFKGIKIELNFNTDIKIYRLIENIEIVDGNEQLLLGVWDERTSTIITIDNSQQSQQSPTSDSKSVIIDELLFSKMKWIDGKEYYFYKNIIVGQYEL